MILGKKDDVLTCCSDVMKCSPQSLHSPETALEESRASVKIEGVGNVSL